ncbi:hypothetical protein Tco_0425265 [Tanacetum coccineum]
MLPETTTTTQTLFSSQNHQVDNYGVKPIRIIPGGPACIVQAVNLRKIADNLKGEEEYVMSTHEYIRKVIEDVGENDDFTCGLWLSTVEYANVDRWIVSGYFGDIKKFLKNIKLKKVVAIIKSYTPNTLGDLIVTLKDLFGTIFGSIHYKVVTEDRWWGLDPHDWSSFQEWQSWILSIQFSSKVKAMLEGVLLDEARVILTDDQNDFLFADASRMEEIEELSANICLMAKIQPADNTSDAGPS